MVTWLVERAQAALATWFLRNMAGRAIADVLTGRFNPTGRLLVTWPRDVGQIVHDRVATVARPLMELKAWEKVALALGQTKTVAFALKAESFCFPGQDFEPMLEPGDFDILVGLNADRKSLLTTSVRLPSWRALPAAG